MLMGGQCKCKTFSLSRYPVPGNPFSYRQHSPLRLVCVMNKISLGRRERKMRIDLEWKKKRKVEFDVLPVSPTRSHILLFRYFSSSSSAGDIPNKHSLTHTHATCHLQFSPRPPPPLPTFDVRTQEIGFYRHYSVALYWKLSIFPPKIA